jgi:hypothetical protein
VLCLGCGGHSVILFTCAATLFCFARCCFIVVVPLSPFFFAFCATPPKVIIQMLMNHRRLTPIGTLFIHFVLLCFVFWAHAEPHSTPPADDLIQGEPYHHLRPPHDERFNGHLAHYITLSKLTFGNLRLAQGALHDIRAGTRTFLDFAKDLSIENAKSGRSNPALQNGDLGLVTYDLLEEELSEVAFDIRNPLTKDADGILGPVCTPSGCSLMAVFSRFRKSFFSDAWWEADQYCRDHDVQFSELLQRLGTDSMSLVASVIWPQEHVVFKKLKLRQLKSDLSRLNDVDPSTVINTPQVAPSRGDMGGHQKLMKRREHIFAKMEKEVLENHTEIYAMSIEQIVKRGFITQELLDSIDEVIAEEDRREKEALQAELNDFELVSGTKVLKRKSQAQPPTTVCGSGELRGDSICEGTMETHGTQKKKDDDQDGSW